MKGIPDYINPNVGQVTGAQNMVFCRRKPYPECWFVWSSINLTEL